MNYKCENCFTIIPESEVSDVLKCPLCAGTEMKKMCENDHLCVCKEDVTAGVRYCEKCGEITCPDGCHDVIGVSRVKRV